MQAFEKKVRQLDRFAREKVRPAHVTDEESVPAEDRNGFLPACEVSRHVGDVLGGVAGGFQDVELDFVYP